MKISVKVCYVDFHSYPISCKNVSQILTKVSAFIEIHYVDIFVEDKNTPAQYVYD